MAIGRSVPEISECHKEATMDGWMDGWMDVSMCMIAFFEVFVEYLEIGSTDLYDFWHGY